MAQPSRYSWRDWVPVITAFVMLAGMLLTAGGILNQVKDHERRLSILEQKRDAVDDKLNVIDVRTARIEGKIETLMPDSKRGQSQ